MLKQEQTGEQVGNENAGASVASCVFEERQDTQQEAELRQVQENETATTAVHSTLVQAEYAEQLMATVQTEARKLRRCRAITRNLAIVFGSLVGLFLLIVILRGFIQGKWEDFGLFTNLSWIGGLTGAAAAASATHKSAVSELATIEDIRAVGPLAESLVIEEKKVRAQIEDALIRLLPRLQASDAGLLNAEQRACLNRALNGKNNALTITILRAYEQVGDASALPFVEALAHATPGNAQPAVPMAEVSSADLPAATTGTKLADGLLGAKSQGAPSERISQAAQACLPYLRQRIELQRASQTLLRGASANDVAPNTLLRAAQDHADTPPEQLLRATTS